MFWSFVRDNTLTKLLFCLNQYGVHRMLTTHLPLRSHPAQNHHLRTLTGAHRSCTLQHRPMGGTSSSRRRIRQRSTPLQLRLGNGTPQRLRKGKGILLVQTNRRQLHQRRQTLQHQTSPPTLPSPKSRDKFVRGNVACILNDILENVA